MSVNIHPTQKFVLQEHEARVQEKREDISEVEKEIKALREVIQRKEGLRKRMLEELWALNKCRFCDETMIEQWVWHFILNHFLLCLHFRNDSRK